MERYVFIFIWCMAIASLATAMPSDDGELAPTEEAIFPSTEKNEVGTNPDNTVVHPTVVKSGSKTILYTNYTGLSYCGGPINNITCPEKTVTCKISSVWTGNNATTKFECIDSAGAVVYSEDKEGIYADDKVGFNADQLHDFTYSIWKKITEACEKLRSSLKLPPSFTCPTMEQEKEKDLHEIH